MNRVRGPVVVAVAIMLTATVVLAGTAYKLSCDNQKCSFAWSLGLGGGGSFEKISGYCLSCEGFVSVTWSRKGRAPLGRKVWDPKTGEVISLYPCPKCRNLFMPIRRIEDLVHCPKCRKATIKAKAWLLYD